MNQNSGRTNISDILPQRCYEHFEKKPRWYHQDQKKRFLYFISSYAYNKKQKSQCANFLNPGISTLAIQKGMSTLFYLNNQVSGYTPEFSRISNLQCQLAFVIFNQFIRTGRMSSQ